MGVDGASCNDPRQHKHGRRTSVHDLRRKSCADIENKFAELLNQDYPRYSDASLKRRRRFAHKALRKWSTSMPLSSRSRCVLALQHFGLLAGR